MRSLLFAIVLISFVLGKAEKVRYDNYRVYSVEVENHKQLEVLQKIERHKKGVKLMDMPSLSRKSTEIIVPPHQFANISELFEVHRMKNEIKTDNLQKLIDEETLENSAKTSFGWNQYYKLDQIYNWLDEQLLAYPDILTNLTVGKTYENRTIRAVKLSHKPGNPIIFIESTIHSREWITVATATYFLNELLQSKDPDIRKLAKQYDWIIIPVLNIDGFIYTHTNDRLWRKSRQHYFEDCFGADINRNFDFHFAEAGTRPNPCSNVFPGSKPFHGHTEQHCPNHDDLMQIAEKTRIAFEKRYGTQYLVGNLATTIYPASSTSMDWVYGVQNISLSYTIEFRDIRRGRYAFELPKEFIIPNSLEVIDGIKAMVKEAQMLKYL